jgi:GntR family transcriptional regulator of arabinose operon
MRQKSRMPLYMQIQEYYKNQISSKRLSKNDKLPAEREIMKKFNVSRITVANALAELAKEGWIYRIPGKGSFVQGIAQETRKSVMESEGEETVRNKSFGFSAQKLANRKMIGLIMPSVEDFFAIRLINGINEVLKQTDYSLMIMLTHNSKEIEQDVIREMLRIQTAGLLIFPADAETYNDEILELKFRDVPFVLIDRYLPGVETNYVHSDNVSGAKLAVSHLWDLGHREIAICSDAALPTVTVDDRIKGYMDALTERDAMINPSLILTNFRVDYENLDDADPLYRYMKKRSASAYITLNAKLGIHISRLAKHMRLNIPEDISILTFDDPSYGYDDFGGFTHISQSEREIGKEAAKILVQQLDDREHNKPFSYKKKKLTPKLVVKETTGQFKHSQIKSHSR